MTIHDKDLGPLGGSEEPGKKESWARKNEVRKDKQGEVVKKGGKELQPRDTRSRHRRGGEVEIKVKAEWATFSKIPRKPKTRRRKAQRRAKNPVSPQGKGLLTLLHLSARRDCIG